MGRRAAGREEIAKRDLWSSRIEGAAQRAIDCQQHEVGNVANIDDLNRSRAVAGCQHDVPILKPSQPQVEVRRVVATTLDCAGSHDCEPVPEDGREATFALRLAPVVRALAAVPWSKGRILRQVRPSPVCSVVGADRRDIYVLLRPIRQRACRRLHQYGIVRPDIDHDVPAPATELRQVLLFRSAAAKTPQLFEFRKEFRVGDAAIEQGHGMAVGGRRLHERRTEKQRAAEHQYAFRLDRGRSPDGYERRCGERRSERGSEKITPQHGLHSVENSFARETARGETPGVVSW